MDFYFNDKLVEVEWHVEADFYNSKFIWARYMSYPYLTLTDKELDELTRKYNDYLYDKWLQHTLIDD